MREKDGMVIIIKFLKDQRLDFKMKLQRKLRRRQKLILLKYNVERSSRMLLRNAR